MALGGHAATMSIQQQQQLTKLSQNRTLPKWSFGGRRGGVGLRHTSPGPGSYGEALLSHRASPAFGFGTSGRDNGLRPTTAPGPGQYGVQRRPASRAPDFSFGTSSRLPSSATYTPGPGAYAPSVETTKRSMPGYSLTPRRAPGGAKDATPGPGAHQQPASPPHAGAVPAWGFGTAGRDQRGANQNPGPGSYNVGRERAEGPAYSMQRRHGAGAGGGISDTPGPGSHGGMYTQFGY